MRVMVLVKATKDSEAGLMPSTELLAAMGRYNDELVAGFWPWQVRDMAEAVAWVKRCPNPMPGPSEIEIRPLFETADFGDALTPELAGRHDRIRETAASR